MTSGTYTRAQLLSALSGTMLLAIMKKHLALYHSHGTRLPVGPPRPTYALTEMSSTNRNTSSDWVQEVVDSFWLQVVNAGLYDEQGVSEPNRD